MWRHPARSASALVPAHARVAVCGLLGLVVMLLACSAQAAEAATENAAVPIQKSGSKADTFETLETGPYEGAWEYRWGDSPHLGSGEFLWAQPGATAERDWRRFTPPGTPPGRAGSKFLWLRSRLVGPRAHDAAMFILLVDQIFEAYLDGVLIYRFGVLDGPGAGQPAGWAPHYLPLGDDYQGKELTLRVYSEHVEIGVVAPEPVERQANPERSALPQRRGQSGPHMSRHGAVQLEAERLGVGRVPIDRPLEGVHEARVDEVAERDVDEGDGR